MDELTSEIERQYEKELLAIAERCVRERVHAHTWEAYQLVAVKQLPPAKVAEKVSMRVNEVYVAKSRVIKLLGQEIARLREQEGTSF